MGVLMKVECAYDELWPIDRLKPHPRNPNKHPDKQIALLAKVIKETGWRSPIVVSERSGYVVKGHGRLLAARVAGFEQVPVDLQAYDSDAQEMADLVADNRIAELSEIDEDILYGLLGNLSTAGMDMELTGYCDQALATVTEQIKASRATFSHQDAEQLQIEDPLANDEFFNQMSAPTKPQLPIIPVYCEHYEAFIIICDNKIDEGFIREKLNLTEKRKSYSDCKFVTPNVINAKEVIESWK